MADMLVKLYDLPDASPLVKELKDRGIVIRVAMPYEKHLVTDWVRNQFSKGWESECSVAFSQHPISCFIATEAGAVVGFACYDSTCPNFFGPTGVADAKRGLGIGKALLLSCMCAMRARGFAYAIIGGVGPAEFYSKVLGATVIEGSTPGIYRDRLQNNIKTDMRSEATR